MKRILLGLFLFFLIRSSSASHIVGASLTYVFNGGSSYTVTLKLYRDCNGIALPSSVPIYVYGYNGAATGLNFTMNLTNPTDSVESNLDPCANPPSPMPCVEIGVYTKTLALPANKGGYHIYWHDYARNTTIINIDVSNSQGESVYMYIPGYDVAYNENFTYADNTTVGSGSPAKWTTTNGATVPTYAKVVSNVFEISGANNAQDTLKTQVIDISAYPGGVNLSVDLSENSSLEANDSILVFYKLNGGALTAFTTIPFKADDFGSTTSTVTGLVGTNVQIYVRVKYDGASAGEIYRIDNVWVSNSSYLTNSDPTFDDFPPLFLCNAEAINFDHSATDLDGDSLVYSFYTPYDGADDATEPGALSPTYSNNVATFTTVQWLNGYASNSPLVPAANLFYEDFPYADNTTVGSGSPSKWTTTNGATPPNYAKVVSNRFEVSGVNNAKDTFKTQVVDISAYTSGVNLNVDLAESGSMDANDTIRVYYKLNGGALTPFTTNPYHADDFGTTLISSTVSTIIGTDVQIYVIVKYDGASPTTELYRIDNVKVTPTIPPQTLYINSSTGVITGTPTEIGQHVVGVRVKEYRAGVFLSETIRDFQFNIVDCPPNTQADITSSASQFTVCLGSVLTFTNVTDTVTDGVPTWSWNFGDPAVTNDTSNIKLPSYTYTAIDTFTARLIINKGTACADTDYIDVYVFSPNPLTASTSPDPAAICFGQLSTALTASGSGGVTPYTYSWNTGETTQSIVASSVGVYWVDVTGGCNSGRDSVTVTQNTAPVNADAGTDQTVCSVSPSVSLDGTITQADSGKWRLGTDAGFSLSRDSVDNTDTPSAAEI